MDEMNDNVFDEDVDTETNDFAPLAVAGLALAGATALGVVAGRKYGAVKARVQEKIAAHRAEKEKESGTPEPENTDEGR